MNGRKPTSISQKVIHNFFGPFIADLLVVPSIGRNWYDGEQKRGKLINKRFYWSHRHRWSLAPSGSSQFIHMPC